MQLVSGSVKSTRRQEESNLIESLPLSGVVQEQCFIISRPDLEFLFFWNKHALSLVETYANIVCAVSPYNLRIILSSLKF